MVHIIRTVPKLAYGMDVLERFAPVCEWSRVLFVMFVIVSMMQGGSQQQISEASFWCMLPSSSKQSENRR